MYVLRFPCVRSRYCCEGASWFAHEFPQRLGCIVVSGWCTCLHSGKWSHHAVQIFSYASSLPWFLIPATCYFSCLWDPRISQVPLLWGHVFVLTILFYSWCRDLLLLACHHLQRSLALLPPPSLIPAGNPIFQYLLISWILGGTHVCSCHQSTCLLT